ncbi:hypothetical protein FXB40_19480 [Bradyrhizobium rifense]|uniref:Uncharacterized protein n=1 Tax=Bradyrhizobium rifense TaxID=515499 RepID=A0A5D3KCN7_9BRAD|nr:hypothetical protein [Bradyrhizobium rifense]TYL94024.1 hypothetical protein FXB40_19480 [Bradyrhizobium rifense]
MQQVQEVLVGLVVVCLFAYTAAAIGYALFKLGWTWFKFTDGLFSLGSYFFMFGLPVSAVAAAAIVSVFQVVAPPQKDGNNLSFEAFSAKFSGPAVPATLWIVTYLALVVSIVAISRATGRQGHQNQSDARSKSAQ